MDKALARFAERWNLDPTTEPFTRIEIDGRLVIYATRNATDQLAAIHKLNREIVNGPRRWSVDGRWMAYAKCRVTHPDGRVEESTGTTEWNGPNSLMIAETKAKRRATLAILGIGILDESEINDTPGIGELPAVSRFKAQLSECHLQNDVYGLWARFLPEFRSLGKAKARPAWEALLSAIAIKEGRDVTPEFREEIFEDYCQWENSEPCTDELPEFTDGFES